MGKSKGFKDLSKILHNSNGSQFAERGTSVPEECKLEWEACLAWELGRGVAKILLNPLFEFFLKKE